MEAINNCEVRDDKVDFLMQLWKEKLKHLDGEKLRQNAAEPLVDDIANYTFDFASDPMKFEVLGNKFADTINKDDEIPPYVDVYIIHENVMRMFGMETREQEAFAMIFKTDDETTRDISLLNEFLAGRYIMRHLHEIDQSQLEKIFADVRYKNVRNFMDGVLRHETFPVELGDNFQLTEKIVHKCVEDKLIFLLDILLERLKVAEIKEVRKILKYTDVSGNNIFHLACERRIKFVLEDLWTLIQMAFGEDSKELANYLLIKNGDEFNAFQLAYEMPLKYNSTDYANEIKNKEVLFRYYRNRGPIELEMYNFESCLNFLYDVGRRHIPERYRKSLFMNKEFKRRSFYLNYVYSKEFSGFRQDFLQLRYFCITKLSFVKTENFQKSSQVYLFLNHYIEKHMATLDESELMELYSKLSFDTYMGDLFKVIVKNYFVKGIRVIANVDSLKTFFEITAKTLGAKEYNFILQERGFNGNNTLQMAILSSNDEIFKLCFDQIKEKSLIDKWVSQKNNDGYSSLYLMIANKEMTMLTILLEYFANNLSEKEIFDIFEHTTKGNRKFWDVCILQYNQSIFNLIWGFLETHVSRENQKLLVDESIISTAIPRRQESATSSALDLISSLFDESEIKQFLAYKNWEGQTAFHVASKNVNLGCLQMLCKFAHAFLEKSDFLELLSHVDANEFNVINPQAPQDDIYNFLPNVLNFSSDRPVFEWAPFLSDIPQNAIQVDSESYVGKSYTENDPYNFNLIKVSPSLMLEDSQCVDVLVGRGIKWLQKTSDEPVKAIKLERSDGNFVISRNQNELNLIHAGSSENCEVLAIDDKEVQSNDNPNWLFRRVY